MWALAVVARTFGVLPTVVARDLNEDPERLSLVCAEMLQYADAKTAYDQARDQNARNALVGSSRLAAEAEVNAFALAKERREAQKGPNGNA